MSIQNPLFQTLLCCKEILPAQENFIFKDRDQDRVSGKGV